MLKELEAGVSATDLIRKHGIARNTLYRWKSKYGGMEVSEARELKRLADENRRLKQMVTDLSLDNKALRSVVKKSGRPDSEEGGRAGPRRGAWAERATQLPPGRRVALEQPLQGASC